MPQLNKETCFAGLFDTTFNMVNLDLKEITKAVDNGTAPFKKLIHCNMGNPNSVGQKEIAYVRQLIAGVVFPDLLEMSVFPADVITRCRLILDSCIGKNSGSYQETEGIQVVREHVAEYISNRDGFPCSYESVFMCNGAQEAIQTILRPIIRSTDDAILCPLPGFPQYNATVTYLGGVEVSYELNEADNWSVSVDNLRAAIKNTKKNVRCLVVINPNNPVGSVYKADELNKMLEFAHEQNLIVISDEVYQHNVFKGQFLSVRQCLKELNKQGKCLGLELFSVNSASKSMYGECGRRGGYWQIENIDKKVIDQMLDIVSLGAINVDGMVAMDAIVKPPVKGEESYTMWQEQYQGILSSMTRKAKNVSAEMHGWEGITCNEPEGAMYVFPRIHASAKAIAHAQKLGKKADELYCQELLEQVGVICLPGCMFGQGAGTYHLRMTILPDEAEMADLMIRWRKFHLDWMKKYE